MEQQVIFEKNIYLCKAGSSMKNSFFEHVDKVIESGLTDKYGKQHSLLLDFVDEKTSESESSSCSSNYVDP